jgi:hypothetical protein
MPANTTPLDLYCIIPFPTNPAHSRPSKRPPQQATRPILALETPIPHLDSRHIRPRLSQARILELLEAVTHLAEPQQRRSAVEIFIDWLCGRESESGQSAQSTGSEAEKAKANRGDKREKGGGGRRGGHTGASTAEATLSVCGVDWPEAEPEPEPELALGSRRAAVMRRPRRSKAGEGGSSRAARLARRLGRGRVLFVETRARAAEGSCEGIGW